MVGQWYEFSSPSIYMVARHYFDAPKYHMIIDCADSDIFKFINLNRVGVDFAEVKRR